MDKKKIQEIFIGSTMLEIPYFQRSYVWDETSIEVRHKDLIEKIKMVWLYSNVR